MITKQQLEAELELEKKLSLQREESDRKYAIKLVEKIVFGFVGIVLTVVIGALLALIITKTNVFIP